MHLHASRLGVAFLALVVGQPTVAASRGHAVDQLMLPTTNAQSNARAIDLDGDGQPENQFGNALAGMVSLEFDIAAATQQSVLAGSIVHLIGLQSANPAFTNDAAAEATWYVGAPTPTPPTFDGTYMFSFDPAVDPTRFVAPLANGVFVSANPVTARPPAVLAVRIRVGSQVVMLSLWGARIAFTVGPNGLTAGQVNGAILEEEIEVLFVPAVAVAFNEIVQADPQSDRAQTLLNLFDKEPTDGFISAGEVATHAFFETALRPDLDIFDANGNYVPDPDGPGFDALSFGFGFTAIATPTRLPLIFADGFEG